MNLNIKRHHTLPTGGFFGASLMFHLECKVALTAEEQALVDKYADGSFPMGAFEEGGKEEPRTITLSDLKRGYSVSSRSVSRLANTIGSLREGCESLHASLKAMSQWDGEIALTIPNEGDKAT